MSYRPLTDLWILARAKLKGGETYYGAYPGGFPERARSLLGVTINDPVLHVCGGKARLYPYKGGFGPHDKTLDLDDSLEPDYLQDARNPFPLQHPRKSVCDRPEGCLRQSQDVACRCDPWGEWPAILIDPPYTEQDAEKYAPGKYAFPSANLLLKNGLQAVRPGGRVGILHYLIPQPPPESIGFTTKFIAVVAVMVGFNNRIRAYSVFEREVPTK